VRTEFGEVEVLSDDDLLGNDSVILSVRPRRGARRGAASRDNVWDAKVDQKVFLGEFIELPGEARRPHPALAIPPVAAHTRRRRHLRETPSENAWPLRPRDRCPRKTTRNDKHTVSPAKRRWASDVIVDLLHAYELPHAALNPGASYRGLHDSIVNYGGNHPTMMLCQHEERRCRIAHGYAKASGQPMVAILHKLVGLLHANMAIYYAYIDRAPIFNRRRDRSHGREPSAARASTGSIPRRTRARRCATTPSGTTSRIR